MNTVDFNRLCGSDSKRLASYRILDIGCGTGRHTCAAFRFSKVVAIGIDIKFEDVIETKNRLIFQKNLGENGGGVLALAVADMLSLPFKDNFFDLVICSEVLEHIHDHKAAVSETIRVLKPGKDLVISAPRYLPERICWWISILTVRVFR